MAPIFILILWRWQKAGTIFLLALATLSTVGRFYITISEQLSNYVYFGASLVAFCSLFSCNSVFSSKLIEIFRSCRIKQLFKTADYMYSIPVHRATIYILGILMGYVLRKFQHIRLNNVRFGFIKISRSPGWPNSIAKRPNFDPTLSFFRKNLPYFSLDSNELRMGNKYHCIHLHSVRAGFNGKY